MCIRDRIRTILEDYILEREQMTNLFVLIDSRLEPQNIDLEFMEWLGENGIPFSIIFTQADKLKGGRLKMNVNAYLRELSKQWEMCIRDRQWGGDSCEGNPAVVCLSSCEQTEGKHSQ